MNLEISSIAPQLPWLVTIALIGAALFYQVRRVSNLQAELRDREAAIGQLGHDNAALTERLKRLDELTQERDQARDDLNQLQGDKSRVDSDFAAYRSKLEGECKSAEEKIQLLEKAEQRLNTGFENLANRIFEEKHQKFSEVSKTSVEALLNPMKQQLGDFRRRVDEVYDKENEQRTTLKSEISQLKTLNERMSTDALNLTKALKGDSKVRGNWGEVQLERLLEDSGLAKGREYEVQASLKNEEGKRFQPDVIVHLPENKDVVIDSKVSLVAYEAYHSSEDDAEREAQIRAHIVSLRAHIKGLGLKNYDELIGVNSLDLVIMFVPIESALMLALEHEPNLTNEAFDKGILLVSPTTLMGTLQIINNIWRYEYQNRNTIAIATAAGGLHDQFVLFVESLEKVGDHIRKAGESFETAKKRLVTGNGNIVGRTKKLQVLGAKTKKNLPAGLVEQAETLTPELLAEALNT